MIVEVVNQSDQWIRWFNLAFAVMALSGLTMNMIVRRERINRRTRRLMFWVYGLFLYTAYGSGVSIQNDAPITSVTYLITIVLFGFILALIWHPDGDDLKPPNDGSIGQWFFNLFNHVGLQVKGYYNRHYQEDHPDNGDGI